MKIAVLGAGFTGLSAAYYLSKTKGYEIDVYESDSVPGGLAVGYNKNDWDWSLEIHYHHWFTNDHEILSLAEEIGHKAITKRPKTSIYCEGNIVQVDSPISLLKFDSLSFANRLRTGACLAFLKLNPYWKPLERFTAKEFLLKTAGRQSWEIMWKPLFVGKFGKYADKVPASWFWARIKKRTPSLSYPVGGFQSFADNLEKKAKKGGVDFFYNQKVEKLSVEKEKVVLKSGKKNTDYDYIISTLPFAILDKIVKLPPQYSKRIPKRKMLGAINIILELKNKFLQDRTYWLNINAKGYPFIAVVEHTNFMDKKHYGNNNVLYVGGYYPQDHKFFNYSKQKVLDTYLPYLQKINKKFDKKQIITADVFKSKYAQPLTPLNYSKNLKNLKSPVERILVANMEMVYPWDRGTNYAIEGGRKIAQTLNKKV